MFFCLNLSNIDLVLHHKTCGAFASLCEPLRIALRCDREDLARWPWMPMGPLCVWIRREGCMTKRRYVTTWDENRLQHDGVDSNVAKVICYIGCSGLCDCGARGVCKPANWLASWTACYPHRHLWSYSTQQCWSKFPIRHQFSSNCQYSKSTSLSRLHTH